MNEALKGILIFLLGGASGAFLGWHFTKKKCEKDKNEELAELREGYREELQKYKTDESEAAEEIEKCENALDNLSETASKVTDSYQKLVDSYRSQVGEKLEEDIRNSRSAEKESEDEEEFDEPEEEDAPYMISEACFDTKPDWNTLTFFWYANRVLTDDDNNPIAESVWADYVPFDFYLHFGEESDDAVFVRCPRLECDIEILRRAGTYIEEKHV